MTTETYGIDAVLPAIDVAISFPMQAAKTIKNKFKLLDILAFIDEFRLLAEVIANKDQVVKEIKDLDQEEKAKVIQYIKDNFDIPDDKVEIFAENALTWADSTFTLIREAKALRNR